VIPSKSEELIDDVLLAAASILSCTSCGVQEHVLALDDQPIDEVFAANYLCDECEEKAC